MQNKKSLLGIFFMISVVFGLFFGTAVKAIPSEQKISPIGGENGANFGNDVDIYGDYAVVGVEDEDGTKGAAYIFVNTPKCFYLWNSCCNWCSWHR